MWMIGKVNKIQRKYLEKMGKEINSVEAYDVEKVVGAEDCPQDNEEMIAVYIEGDMVKDLEAFMIMKEDSKSSNDRKAIHRERLGVLAEMWEGKFSQMRGLDYDIISSEDWTCEGDRYTMQFEYCHNDAMYDTMVGWGIVGFKQGSLEVDGSHWEFDGSAELD